MSNPPRTIRRDVRVFISAVTLELGPTRKLVKKALEDTGCHAFEEDNFPPDYRVVVDTLREHIASCDAVIHIVGSCYGNEPKQRPEEAPRRSYTQLEYDIAVEQGKPVYVFLTGDGFPPAPHEPESPEFQQLQQAHRQRLTSTDKIYNPVASTEQLDQKVRSLRLKEKLFWKWFRGWLALSAVVGIMLVAAIVRVGQWQVAEHRAQEQERQKQERERIAAEAARKQIETIKQIQLGFAEKFLQQLLSNKEIMTEEARRRALNELPGLINLPLTEIEALINRKLATRANEAPVSPLNRALAALANGDYDEVFRAAGDQNRQGRELAMLEGTAALARFRQSPSQDWKERALAAFQRALALSDPNSATEWGVWSDAAYSAASLLHDLARYAEAEPLLRACLQLRQDKFGIDAADVVSVMNNLAGVLAATGRNSEAEPIYRRTMEITERSQGPNHPEVAIRLNNLAALLMATDRLADAEPLLRRALKIAERSQDPIQSDIATGLNNLATLLMLTSRPSDAEPLLRRALAIVERSRGLHHPEVAGALNNLAGLLRATARLSEAEPLFRRALVIAERSQGLNHPDVADRLDNLAGLLDEMDRQTEAEPLYRRALAIAERSLGPDHPDVARHIHNLAVLLKATGRNSEAEPLYRRALAIAERSLGPHHHTVSVALNNLAKLLESTGRNSEAEPLYRRALAIAERSRGPDHPDVADRLNNLAGLLMATIRPWEAEQLLRRALEIDEKSFGPQHPDVARELNNLAGLLLVTDRPEAAEPLMARSISVFSRFWRSTGKEHPRQRSMIKTYRNLLTSQKLVEPEIATRITAAIEGADKLSPIVPEVQRLLGPAIPVSDVLSFLDRRYREQNKPPIWFLPLNEPITPHLDELLGKQVN